MAALSVVTAEFRQAQIDLATVAYDEVLRFWRGLDTTDADEVVRRLEAFMPEVVRDYGDMGAAAAADFYDELRDGSSDVSKAYRARMGDVVNLDQIRASVRIAAGPLYGRGKNPGPEQALRNLYEQTHKLALAPARATVRENVRDDPDSIGWRRVGDGETCNFCRMLIGRGEVYTADTARFAAHGRCGCMAEPAWGEGERVNAVQFVASKRNPSPADKARVKAFLDNMDDPAPGERRLPDLTVVQTP